MEAFFRRMRKIQRGPVKSALRLSRSENCKQAARLHTDEDMKLKHSATLFLSLASALFVLHTVSAEPFVYPAEGQSAEQQGQDKYQCYLWAKDQTGVDPAKPVSAAAPASSPRRGGALRGAVIGAGVGAIGGAIGDDTSKGAKIGAGVGATVGVLRQRRGNRAAQASAQQAQVNQQARLGEYDRAFSVCMEGRGYTVR